MAPYLVRATGNVRDARPSSTRKGWETENRSTSLSDTAVRACTANALVESVEISSMSPPRVLGRTLPHSALAPSRHPPRRTSPLDTHEGRVRGQGTESAVGLAA